jgi:hypothetical protein
VTRLVLGGALLAAAAVLVVLSCRWGPLAEGTPILILPGNAPAEGFTTATWLRPVPFGGLVVTVLVPMVLVTSAVWLLARRGGRSSGP